MVTEMWSKVILLFPRSVERRTFHIESFSKVTTSFGKFCGSISMLHKIWPGRVLNLVTPASATKFWNYKNRMSVRVVQPLT